MFKVAQDTVLRTQNKQNIEGLREIIKGNVLTLFSAEPQVLQEMQNIITNMTLCFITKARFGINANEELNLNEIKELFAHTIYALALVKTQDNMRDGLQNLYRQTMRPLTQTFYQRFFK